MPHKTVPRSPRRSLLFTPGDSPRKLNKIRNLTADTIILDLEDAVAVSEKETARRIVCESLAAVDFGQTERLVRLNAAGTGFFNADLLAVAAARPDGLVIPKVETAASLAQIDETLARIERASGWADGAIGLLALIETALGLMNIKDIAQSTPRLTALIFGAEDFTTDLGALRSAAGQEILYARSVVVTAAAAYGLQAVDTVFVDIHDLEGLYEDATFARKLGFSGKLAVHPVQTEAINDVFSPSPAEIANAQRLLRVSAQLRDSGVGAFTVDGRMVDMPMIRAAEQLLQRAFSAGLLED